MSLIHQSPEEIVKTVYADHHGWLSTWLRKRLGDSHDAADVAHDTFLRILIRPRSFDSFDGARACLTTIARGICIDLWRRRDIENAWLEEMALQPEARIPSLEVQAIVLDALRQIDAMLANVSVKAANVFVMGMGLGMSDMEIAAKLGISDRMVRKYMAQAMFHCAALEAEQQGISIV